MNHNKISIYIHIPYCLKKCFYCDFYSMEISSQLNRIGNEYGFLIAQELIFLKKQFPKIFERSLISIYIGGGTPSLFEPEIFSLIFKEIQDVWKNYREAEITIEANPESLSEQKLFAYLKLGINRVSVGVQSFYDNHLIQIGRVHKSSKSVEAIKNIKSLKDFKSYNIDLMFAIPNQSLNLWKETLEQAISLNPPHISVYGLTVHPETQLFNKIQNGELNLPEEELQLNMFLSAKNMLSEAGYTHYEISNYALNGHKSQHNMNYWRGGEYIGIGAGAHSLIEGNHYYNPEDLLFYRNRILDEKLALVKDDELTKDQWLKEKIMLALRMIEGINIQEFNERNNCDILNEFMRPIETLINHKLIEKTDNRILLTEKGLLLADEVTSYFF